MKKRNSETLRKFFASNQSKKSCKDTQGKINECVHGKTHTNFRSRSQKPPNSTLSCDVDTNWPVCQLWLDSSNCMRGNHHTPCVHEDKLPRVARIARNDKKTHKTLRHNFSSNQFKKTCKYTPGMVCNWKICFNVETKQKLVEFWCIFCKISECCSN